MLESYATPVGVPGSARGITTASVVTMLATTAMASLAQAAPAQEGPGRGVIEEVVVIATRREESLQDIPFMVSTVSAERLQESGVDDVRELTFVVPGFVGGRNFGVLQPALRGVGSIGNSPGDESNVALYVDGIYQPHANGNIIDFVAVDRIEVLHGPQGTLFGRNATGGLINVITPDPQFEFDARVGGEGGFFGYSEELTYGFTSYVTGPITEKIAGNLALRYKEDDDYIVNILDGKEIAGLDSTQARGKLLFAPTDRAEIILTLSYAEQEGGNGNIPAPLNNNTFGNIVAGTPLPDQPKEVGVSWTPNLLVRQSAGALRTSFDLGSIRLETSSGYMRDKVFQRSDVDGSVLIGSQNETTIRTKPAWSHELRLLSQHGGPLTWIVGGYYFDLEQEAFSIGYRGLPPDFTTSSTVQSFRTANVDSLSGFGEATFAVTDRLSVVAGARYTSEDRDYAPERNGIPLFPEQSKSDSKWTYRGSLQYAFNDFANIYLTYSTGYKSGVFNTYGVSPDPVRAEEVEAWEFGIKADPLPWLRTNISLFRYDYTDMQVVARVPTDISDVTYELRNAAQSDIQGVDLELQALLPNGFSLAITGNYLDATFDSFPEAQIFTPIPNPSGGYNGNLLGSGDASGNDLLKAPEYSFAVTGRWERTLGNGQHLSANVSVYSSADVYYDHQNRLVQPDYSRVNAVVSWSSADERRRLFLRGENLTDKEIIQQATPTTLTDQITYERPRTVVLGGEYRF